MNEHSSAGAASILIKQYGFTQVYALKGGLDDWKRLKQPIATGSP